MRNLPKLLSAAAAVGTFTSPVSAQYYQSEPSSNYPPYPQQQYPQGYQQQYPQDYQQQYPQGYQQQYPQGYQQQYPGYGYNQGYTGNPVTDIIDQLLGNRYNVTDRQAVRQCARAATAQARNQYGGYPQGYRQGYGYNQGIAAPSLRVTSITEVERRPNGLRVRGTLGTSYGGYSNGYGYGYGYPGQGYGARGDLVFRCNVDYRGVVMDVRVSPNGAYRRY